MPDNSDKLYDDERDVPLMDALAEAYDSRASPFVSTGHQAPALSARFNNFGQISMTPEEAQALKNYLITEEGVSECPENIFNDPDAGTRRLKAVMVNLYYEYEGRWDDVRRDPRSVSWQTLQRYWQDERFRACIFAFYSVFNLRAESVISSFITDESLPPMVRLNAAQVWLRANDGEKWDPGIRKQVVANRGSIANTLFSKAVTQEDVLKTVMTDPFMKKEILAAVGVSEDNQSSNGMGAVKQSVPVPSLLPPKKLSDPFTED